MSRAEGRKQRSVPVVANAAGSVSAVRRPAILLCVAVSALFLSGCRPEQEMARQPSYKPYQASEFFEDGMSARPLIDGTVSRGSVDRDPFLMTGKVDGVTVDRFPFEVTEQVIVRGRERFDAYCSMCHGRDGYGQGMVVRRGFNRPPSLHDPAIRQKPVGHYFDVMTNGYGAMPPHASIVAVTDRWAIASYLRALQLSQGPGSTPDAAAVPAGTPAVNAPAPPGVGR